jgi:cytochrome b
MPPALESATRLASLDDASTIRTRVWDLPTRVFHWALTAAVIGQLATGFGGVMEWHFRIGYAVLSLLLFRVIWGFVGGRW